MRVTATEHSAPQRSLHLLADRVASPDVAPEADAAAPAAPGPRCIGRVMAEGTSVGSNPCQRRIAGSSHRERRARPSPPWENTTHPSPSGWQLMPVRSSPSMNNDKAAGSALPTQCGLCCQRSEMQFAPDAFKHASRLSHSRLSRYRSWLSHIERC